MTDRQRLARPAEDHLLMRDEARRRTSGSESRPPSGRTSPSRYRRGIELRRGVQLDDLGLRERTHRLGREPHHQHRAQRKVRGDEARRTMLRESASSRRAPSVRPWFRSHTEHRLERDAGIGDNRIRGGELRRRHVRLVYRLSNLDPGDLVTRIAQGRDGRRGRIGDAGGPARCGSRGHRDRGWRAGRAGRT